MDSTKLKNIRKFFAMCSDAGFDSEESKERVKKKFNLEHFTDISSEQLDQVTKSLQNYIDTKILGVPVKTAINKPKYEPY